MARAAAIQVQGGGRCRRSEPGMPGMVTALEAVNILGCPEYRFRELVSEGRLMTILKGRRTYVSAVDVLRVKNEQVRMVIPGRNVSQSVVESNLDQRLHCLILEFCDCAAFLTGYWSRRDDVPMITGATRYRRINDAKRRC